jgi:hypothetical protein
MFYNPIFVPNSARPEFEQLSPDTQDLVCAAEAQGYRKFRFDPNTGILAGQAPGARQDERTEITWETLEQLIKLNQFQDEGIPGPTP